jgi:hypothetical protein
VTDHDGEMLGINPSCRDNRVAKKSATTDRVQDLGYGRLHPGAFACGEDDDGGRAGCSHAMSS